MRIACALVLLCPLLSVRALPAQSDFLIANALTSWASYYDQQRIPLEEFFDQEHEKAWGSAVEAGGTLYRYVGKTSKYSHRKILVRLFERCEQDSSELTVRATLEIASVGSAYPMFDRDAEQLRDLGTWSIMRSSGDHVSATLVKVATGDLGSLRKRRERTHAIALRCAAVRILALRGGEPARLMAESLLQAEALQLRLVAAEALGRLRSPKSIGPLYRRLHKEKSPLVTQALIDAQRVIFAKHGEKLSQAQVDTALEVAFANLPVHGWRTDMSILALAEGLPSLRSIPHLIVALDPKAERQAKIYGVGSQGSSVCRNRAWRALRKLTGALIEIDDVDGWREFYREEGSKLKLIPRDKWNNKAIRTSSGFYGIPVVGRETVFVIDTSKSMRRKVRQPEGRQLGSRRIDLARNQLLAALQGMPPEWRFRLVTFSSKVIEWNKRPARPTTRACRDVARILETLQPDGRTNMAEALGRVLNVGGLQFGVQVQHSVDEVFVLSDGMPSDIEDPQKFLAWLRQVNRYQKVRINTVYAGDGPGRDLMRDIAAQHGGDFVQW